MEAIFNFYVTTTEGDDTAKSVLIENDSELVEIHLNDKEKIFLEVDATSSRCGHEGLQDV